MRASLRSTLALMAVGALGFAAGGYLGWDAPQHSDPLTIPSFTPAGPGPAVPPVASGGGQPRWPDTLAEIMRLRGDFSQTTALYLLASSRDRNGIEQLLREAASIRQPSERRAAIAILYGRFAELDPEAAIEHIMSRDADFDPGWLYGVFHTWARTDLEGALARAAKLDERNRIMGGTAILRARDDLPQKEREALAAKLNLSVPVQEPSALDLRTPKAAERAWRAALATDDRESRLMRLHTLADAWARQDPHAALHAIESLQDRSLRDQLLLQGLHAWSQKEPRDAVDWAFARPPSAERTQLLATALSSLVTREPSAAMGMTERLSNAERLQILPQVLTQWATVDMQSAAAWAENLESPQLRNNALMSIASTYAFRHPDEAFRWAASLSEPDSQPVMSAVIDQIAASDPVRASVSQMRNGPQRKGAVVDIANHWAQWDPQATLAWVAKLPASDADPSLYSSIFGQWAVHDAEAAVDQLSRIDDTGNRDIAILGILGSPYLEPDLAERLYRRIEGGDARRQAAMQLMHYYSARESNPEVAERYRIEAGYPENPEQTIVIQ